MGSRWTNGPLVPLLFLALGLGAAEADRLETRDGAVHVGRIRSAASTVCVLDGRTGPRLFPLREVLRIDLGPEGASKGTSSVEAPSALLGPLSPRERGFVGENPAAQAWLLSERVEQVLENDGHRSLRLTRRVLLGKRSGDWRRLSLTYGPLDERPRVLWAQVVSPEGKSRAVEERSGVDGGAAPDYSAYGRRRLWSFSFPAAVEGAVLVCAVELRGRGHERGWDFAPAHWFGREIPVMEESFSVTVPAGRRLRYLSRRMGGLGTPSVEGLRGGAQRFSWRVDGQKALPREKGRPALSELLPFVRTTLLENWGQVCSYMGPRLDARLRPDAAIASLAEKLGGRVGPVRERVERAFAWHRRRIRYLSTDGGEDLAGSPAADVLRRGHGDCVDQCILLASLLSCMDVEARPVAVCTRGYRGFDPEIPTLYAANHYLLRVDLPEGALYLDPTDRVHRFPWLPPACQGVVCLDERSGQFHRTPVFPAESNLLVHQLDLELSPTGELHGHFRLEGQGAPEGRLRRSFRGLTAPRSRAWARAWLSARIPGAELLNLKAAHADDLERPFVLEGELRLARGMREEGPLLPRALRLPALSTVPTASLEGRKTPLSLPSTMTLVDRLRLRLPDRCRAQVARRKIHASCKAGRVEGGVEEGEGVLRLDLVYARPLRDLSPERAEKLRSVLDRRDRFLRQVLIVDEEGGGRG